MSLQIILKVVVDDENVIDDFSDDEWTLADRYVSDIFTFVLDDNPDIEVEVLEAGKFD